LSFFDCPSFLLLACPQPKNVKIDAIIGIILIFVNVVIVYAAASFSLTANVCVCETSFAKHSYRSTWRNWFRVFLNYL
jgi:hypothetical protein